MALSAVLTTAVVSESIIESPMPSSYDAMASDGYSFGIRHRPADQEAGHQRLSSNALVSLPTPRPGAEAA
ncbi:hypothetical protein DNJ95_01845 [Stutzerimonas kirkiae]|uniref:Uncharacterized protein n=1 Tax=Stutzerimonas kirkiae TaxID=2211392 RepID=A0A4Q9RDY7_9GAMM|nr:hypothetical protein DNJ96_01175 [Stutzerimonas kirkiae]TBV05642.1 hypothetical protein DNJ95_01845 [Stutzerimonas kirkiae]TBV10617.1 hypothetical protein DNK08_06215 [Stutzerimonas kirkiae]TBV17472.1 hypothetical protein DNK01_01040 [Stutzerimonas kirkiae]